MKTNLRPQPGEYAEHFAKYVKLVPDGDILPLLDLQPTVLRALAARLTPSQETFAYAPGKWTIRQVAGHVCDVERVFGFRAFTFSRFDPNALPGFDEDGYVEHAPYADIAVGDLVEEFALLRNANLRVLRGLTDQQWTASGVSNSKPITVRALAYLMAGHVSHHLALLHDRYGVSR